MEGMLNDLAICTEQSAAFELFCRENPQRTGLGRTELSVQVPPSNPWPMILIFAMSTLLSAL